MSMTNDFEEDLDGFPLENKENRPNLWLEHTAQSRQMYILKEVESHRRFHRFLKDRRPGSSRKTRASTEEQRTTSP